MNIIEAVLEQATVITNATKAIEELTSAYEKAAEDSKDVLILRISSESLKVHAARIALLDALSNLNPNYNEVSSVIGTYIRDSGYLRAISTLSVLHGIHLIF